MEKIDLRSLSAERRAELKRVAVRMHRRGWKKTQIAAELGIRRSTVQIWVLSYLKGGTMGLKEAKRGMTPGFGAPSDAGPRSANQTCDH